MYFPRLYPDELLYSGIARCRVHLGIGSHKTLLHMLFGNGKVAAITDLPTHLSALAKNTGLDTAQVIMHHTLFPLYAPFIPEKRRTDLFQAMRASDRPTIGLAGASTALVKWPDWLRYCPLCIKDMSAHFGEPYWRRSWQIQGIDACPEHGCQLLNSPIPFRRAQRHEFHSASPQFLSRDLRASPASEVATRLARAVTQLLVLRETRSPGYGRWTNLYRHLATECCASRGRQVRAELIWEKILATHSRDWLTVNGLMGSGELPPWLLAMFRKHRKGFSALQHMIVWTSLRTGWHVEDWIRDANSHQAEVLRGQSKQLFADNWKKRQCRTQWQQAIDTHGFAKLARVNGGNACYAWLYRHDKAWLIKVNQARRSQFGNNSRVNWLGRDRQLVRLLIKIGREAGENLGLPRQSRSWFLNQIPHRASVERNLEKLPLCRAFFERYAESIAEYQIRRLTQTLIKDLIEGIQSKRWEIEKRCGFEKAKIAPLTENMFRLIGLA